MQPTSTPKVTAIILNFNLVQYTIECLHSLENIDYPNLEILVIDNGSTDDSIKRLKETFPHLDVHATGENLGYTGGINVGFQRALMGKPKYILVLNPDTEVDPRFLSYLVAAMEARPMAAGACGTIYTDHERTRVWYAGGRMIPWRGLAVHNHENEILDPALLGEPYPVTFVTGCMILFRAALLEEVGLEDERFFMVLDDIEFSARILKKGYELLYVPKALIYHKVMGEKESPFKLYYGVRNRLLLINTSFSGSTRLIARVYFLCVISLKMAFWFLTNRTFARAAAYGMKDYFQGNFGKGRGVLEFKYRDPL